MHIYILCFGIIKLKHIRKCLAVYNSLFMKKYYMNGLILCLGDHKEETFVYSVCSDYTEPVMEVPELLHGIC